MHSWEWSIASKSSHVFGDDRRDESSCVVRCIISCSYSGGNGGGGGGRGSPFFFSYMLSCKHFHQLIHLCFQCINIILHSRLFSCILIHCFSYVDSGFVRTSSSQLESEERKMQ